MQWKYLWNIWKFDAKKWGLWNITCGIYRKPLKRFKVWWEKNLHDEVETWRIGKPWVIEEKLMWKLRNREGNLTELLNWTEL